MDKVKEYLAIACLAYKEGDTDFALRSFLQGMNEATSSGEQGLQQVVDFLRAPVAQLVADVPAAENTMAPALHSDDANQPESGVNALDTEKPVDPQPVVAPIPEPVPSTITSLSSMLLDDGDEELEARAEAEDEIDEDDLDEEDDEDESDDSEEDDDEEMQLSISSSTPLRLKQG